MSFQLWDLLQDTALCEGAGLGRDRERDALLNLHPSPEFSSQKKKKKNHIASAFWHSNMNKFKTS